MNNKEFLDNYTEYYNKNKENYDNFWKSIEDGTNSNLSKWEEEFKYLPVLATVRAAFDIIENHAEMEVFLQDGLCTYFIKYIKANDVGNPFRQPCYYLLSTNLLSGSFIEEYVIFEDLRSRTVRDILLRMHKHPVITPVQISSSVITTTFSPSHQELEYFTGETIEGAEDKAVISVRYINESKTLYYIAVRKEDGKYYPTTYTSITKSDLKEKVKELCLS